MGGWPKNSTQMSGRVRKKFQMTNFTMLNNISFMIHALKVVPGLADVGVPHGEGMAPEPPPGVWNGGSLEKVSND